VAKAAQAFDIDRGVRPAVPTIDSRGGDGGPCATVKLKRRLCPPEKQHEESPVERPEAAVIGTGWCGGIRAETLSRSALCSKLHICDIRPDRLAEVKALTGPATATLDYQDIVKNPDISAVYISTTPEHTHYPIARDCLKAGKHVLLEKPIAMELFEADELIEIAKRNNVKFTIGYSQRFNTKVAYAKKKIADGTLGHPVSVMVSRHLSRSLGKKIAGRVRLSPAAMESTHDLDFVFWLLEPAKPVRVYSQGAYGYMKPVNGSYDVMWTTVTMDNGVLVAIGGGWNLPPSYPNYCATWIEITGTEGSLFLDDSQRDNWLNTVAGGTQFPMSTMPGEQVDHVFAGQMGPETLHFLESVMLDREPMVSPESARRVMECYLAADLSAESGEPVDVPLNNQALAAVQDLYKKFRTPV
jgi:predicted dehydrogenase